MSSSKGVHEFAHDKEAKPTKTSNALHLLLILGGGKGGWGTLVLFVESVLNSDDTSTGFQSHG